MPNVADKFSPPSGMVFVFLQYTTVKATRSNGQSNMWFNIKPTDNPNLWGLVRYTGCNTEYGIKIDSRENDKPFMISEAD